MLFPPKRRCVKVLGFTFCLAFIFYSGWPVNDAEKKYKERGVNRFKENPKPVPLPAHEDVEYEQKGEDQGLVSIHQEDYQDLLTNLTNPNTAYDEQLTGIGLDRKMEFGTWAFVFKGEEWNRKLAVSKKVTLVTQTSVDGLPLFVESMDNWKGWINLALYVPGTDLHLALIFVQYLRACFPQIRARASFHFTFPKDQTVKTHPHLKPAISMSCRNPREAYEKITEDLPKTDTKVVQPHPHNALRNVAKKTCQTEYMFLVDVDMIPNPGLGPDLGAFLASPSRSECPKCCYVVPIFGLSLQAPGRPQNKEELLRYQKRDLAVPFYSRRTGQAHSATRNEVWSSLPPSRTLGVGYPLTKYTYAYEPLFVARVQGYPDFEPGFKGFAANRFSQVYEMYMAGYQFAVLNNAFLVHPGIKIKTRAKQGQKPANEEKMYREQVQKNMKLWQRLEKHLNKKYGESRACKRSQKNGCEFAKFSDI